MPDIQEVLAFLWVFGIVLWWARAWHEIVYCLQNDMTENPQMTLIGCLALSLIPFYNIRSVILNDFFIPCFQNE